MIIYQIFMIILLNIIAPILIGGLFQTDICRTKASQVAYRYTVGFFVMLAIYQLLEVPMALLYVKFHVLVIVYSIVLLFLLAVAIVKWRKDKTFFPYVVKNKKEKAGAYAIIYLVVFGVVVAYQLYHTIFWQMNELSLDDATYVVYANDAVQTDLLYLIDPSTGIYSGLNIQRLLQSSIVYPSFITKLTGIDVTIIEHTIWPVFLVIMAYEVYYLIAERLFDEKENQYLFLLFTSLLYNFGFHSYYSVTFRLLGTMWQGKGILATVLNFLYLYIFSDIYQKKYHWKMGVLLFFISIASVGLTLGGVISTVVISGVLFVLFWFKNHNWNNIKYLIWANIMPVFYAAFYLWQR